MPDAKPAHRIHPLMHTGSALGQGQALRARPQEPLAGASGLAAERQRPAARAVHVGPHVLRVVDPARQGRDVDGDAFLRGLLLLRPLVSLDRLDRRRRRALAARRARDARGAQVPDQLPPVPRVSRPHERRCSTTTRRSGAGRSFTGFALFFLASVHLLRDADAARSHRPVRVAPTGSGASTTGRSTSCCCSPSNCTAASACIAWP